MIKSPELQALTIGNTISIAIGPLCSRSEVEGFLGWVIGPFALVGAGRGFESGSFLEAGLDSVYNRSATLNKRRQQYSKIVVDLEHRDLVRIGCGICVHWYRRWSLLWRRGFGSGGS